jgi:hypothetical protein
MFSLILTFGNPRYFKFHISCSYPTAYVVSQNTSEALCHVKCDAAFMCSEKLSPRPTAKLENLRNRKILKRANLNSLSIRLTAACRYCWHTYSSFSSALSHVWCLTPLVTKGTSCSLGRAWKQRPDAWLLSPPLVLHMTCDMEARDCITNSIRVQIRDTQPARCSLKYVRFLNIIKIWNTK